MTSNFNPPHNNQPPRPEQDCFELLSAYIDGEVTAAERQQVQHLLDTDANTKKLYTQLLQLQQGIQNIPAPPKQQSAEQLSEKVFQQIERRQHKRALVWGGGAIAAMLVAAVSGLIPGINSPVLRVAESLQNQRPNGRVMLAIAVDKPAVQIPKAAFATFPEQPVKSTQKKDWH